MIPGVFAAWVVTDAARDCAADVRLALARAGISEDRAADIMEIPRSLLSEQLNCQKQKQLSAYRLAVLPQRFHDELDGIRVEKSGGVLLTAGLVSVLRGAAALPKTMLKASLTSAIKERKQA